MKTYYLTIGVKVEANSTLEALAKIPNKYEVISIRVDKDIFARKSET